jgi:pyruvate/2-oxoglutarate dehydrogenase complex dihydrolipoamide acyltransferase (E2) component
MRAEIVLPELGAAPAVLSLWYADFDEVIFEGDRLLEILVSGATFDISAPATGRLLEKTVLPNDALRPGQVLGVLEVEEESA